jgi:hypothetical protein
MANNPQQSILSENDTARSVREHDFRALFPGRVFPTGNVHVLERDGNLLFIKSYAKGQWITGAQHRIWSILPQFGTPDAPGNITVACVRGIGSHSREVQVFDRMGVHEVRALNRLEWRTWLINWWEEAKLR